MKRIITSLAAVPLAAGALIGVSSPASAAATCSYAAYTITRGSFTFHIPGYWTGSANSTNCTLREGNSGPPVTRLQYALRMCYQQGIAVDGDFGPATRQALMNAQTWEREVRHQNVSSDGVYGPQTRDVLTWDASWAGQPVCSRLSTATFGTPHYP